jgi:hypothetical protein
MRVYLTIPPTSNTRPTSVVVTSNTLVLVLLASREHAHDMLLVSVLVSEVELKLSIDTSITDRLYMYTTKT